MGDSVHQRDETMIGDKGFEPGELGHLVVGARGRLLDPRRTPVAVTRVMTDMAMFEVEILAFEDVGATWRLPLEDVRKFQFERGAARGSKGDVAAFEAAVARFAEPVSIEAGEVARRSTEARIASVQDEARAFIGAAEFDASAAVQATIAGEAADARLHDLFERFIRERGVADLESHFAADFVSNPHAGEFIKAHRMAIAELGLCAYHGGAVRDASVLDGAASAARRQEHVVARLAFVRALFTSADLDSLVLYRGVSGPGTLCERQVGTFISSTFARTVADSFVLERETVDFGVLAWQRVKLGRVFMTHVETPQLNGIYQEAEAVLLADADNTIF